MDDAIIKILYSQRLINKLQKNPYHVSPIVTQSDERNGYIQRYFVRPTNDKNLIIEVDKNQYNIFKQNKRFIVCQIRWKIIGKKETTVMKNGVTDSGVKDININEVMKIDLTFGGLKNYISNYLEYWIKEY